MYIAKNRFNFAVSNNKKHKRINTKAMKKNVNNNGIKVDNKQLNNVAKGVAKNITILGRDAKKERKGLKQTIRFLLTSESEAGKELREFFKLNPKSNKESCKKACKFIENNYLNAIAVYKFECTANCESDEVEKVFIKLIPASKNGKEKTDYIDVITDIVKVEKVNKPKRMELGRQMKHLWEITTESDKIKFALALKNTFAKKLETLQVKTKIVGEVIM